MSKELSEIKLITELAKQKDEMVKELLDLGDVLNDKNTDEELKTIAAEEFGNLKEAINNMKDIQFALLPKDKDDNHNVILDKSWNRW